MAQSKFLSLVAENSWKFQRWSRINPQLWDAPQIQGGTLGEELEELSPPRAASAHFPSLRQGRDPQSCQGMMETSLGRDNGTAREQSK